MPNCRICGKPQDGQGHCPTHKKCAAEKSAQSSSKGNTNKTRGEDRNQSFGGEAHAKTAKGSGSQTGRYGK